MPSIRRIAITVVVLLLPSLVSAESTIRSDILTLGKPSGQHITTLADDGEIRVHYEYTDRGRGPVLDARYRVGDDGILESAHITGLAYFKTEVDERYTFADGKAAWASAGESGQATPEGPAQYLMLENTPEESAILARALLRATDLTLDILPSGRARIEQLAERTFDDDVLTLYAIHGLGPSPQMLWLDAERQLYATVSAWSTLIRSGEADRAQALLEAQQQAAAALAVSRAERLTRRIDKALLIRNVRAFDPARGEFVGDSVLVRDGRVASIGTALEAPADATTLDGEGRFLMPGLWDMHVHLAGEIDGLLHIANGVTTVRDLANDNALLETRVGDFDAGRDIGPRVIKAGFIDGTGPYAGPSKALAEDAATVREWIDRYAAEGYSQIKLYSSLKPSLVPGAIAYAHEKGLRVSGHVPMGLSAREFIELGADELQHVNFFFLNFLAGPDDDTRTPLRFSLVGDQGGALDLTGAPVQEFITLLKSRRIVVDPTLVAFEDMFTSQPKMPPLTYAAVVDRLPVAWQRAITAGGGGLPATDSAAVMRHRQAYERMVALVGELHRSGVDIVAGTDAIAGFAYVRELELYVQAGIPPGEVLRMATQNAARAMHLDADRGSLAEGHVADLILVDGDPTRVVSDLRRVHTVIRGDRLFEADRLMREVGIDPVRR